MNCHVLLIFFVLSSTVVIGEGATAPYVPTDVFFFDCSNSFDNIDDIGRNWTVENQKTVSSNPANASFTSDLSYENSNVSKVPYMTARIFRSSFTYSFPVTPGSKFIRLYFYPINYGPGFDAVSSFFSVTANGFTLLKNFSADLTVKGSILKQMYLIKEFIVPVDHKLNLTFTPSRNSSGFVNGIEIVSMPDQLYTKGGFDGIINGVDGGSNEIYTINKNTTALETLYRVNIGGDFVNEVKDTGMFRRWLNETGFLLYTNLETVTIPPGIKINYTEKTPPYVAPNYVYDTSRIMGNPYNPNVNLNFNLTWLFPVETGFIYLMRLHFCEVDLNINGPNQRVFSIFIGNQMAEIEMDVFGLSGGVRIPMYLDFRIYVTNGPLRLDLHPNVEFSLKYFDAILNGVEILKLSNFDGNLAEPNPNPPVSTASTQNGNLKKVKIGNIIKVKIGIALAFGILGLIAIGLIIFKVMSLGLQRRKTSHHRDSIKSLLQLKQYSYAEVKKITKSFSHTVGKGGFGTVYGGNLCDGRKVAVKILKDIKSSGEDFINEVASMSQTSHINIVSLLGFCYDVSKRAIVYEFLENGSLDQFISSKRSLHMDVGTLYGIAIGVARGLEYLHHSCKTRIVHFDIKPQNILLDDNLCPKVSDFGLARL